MFRGLLIASLLLAPAFVSGVTYNPGPSAAAARQYGEVTMTDNGSTTTLTVNVATLPAGTSAAGTNSGFTASTANRLTYNGSATKQFKVTAQVNLRTSSTNKEIEMRIFKNGVAQNKTLVKRRDSDSGSRHSATLHGIIQLATNDFIEVKITNITDSTNAVVENLQILIVEV